MITKNTRICFFNSCKIWGGGEKWHYSMALKLHERGCHILVITNKKSELFKKIAGEPVEKQQIAVSGLSFLNIFKLIRVYRIFRKHRIKAVILGMTSDIKLAGLAAKLAGVEKIIYRRGMALPTKNSWLNRFYYRKILTDIITNSLEIKQKILERNAWLVPEEKIRIIHNGVDINRFNPEIERPVFREGKGMIYLGNAGRLVEQKGKKYLLDAAEKLRIQGIPFRILIAGTGRLEPALKQMTAEKRLEKEITFLGFVEDIKGFMDSIDIFVLTSLHEGTSNVLIEAMAYQKPVVAFNISSNPELILHKETGLLVKPFDTGEFANSIITLAENREMAARYGKNARQRIREKFSTSLAIEKLMETVEN